MVVDGFAKMDGVDDGGRKGCARELQMVSKMVACRDGGGMVTHADEKKSV